MDGGSSGRRIFAYGTLRRDAPMHALLGGSAHFLGAARFQGRLWSCGAFPGVTDSPRRSDVVHGELYELLPHSLDETLARLDRYEGDGFERSQRQVTLVAGGTCLAWVYLYLGNTRRARRIASGDYLKELRTGPQKG